MPYEPTLGDFFDVLDSMSKLPKDKSELNPLEKCGNFWLSVQHSDGHYCDKDTVEIAIFEGPDQHWVMPRTDPRFKSFEWSARFLEKWDGCSSSVAGYFPGKLLRQVRKDLEGLS